ncbi:MAG TPA: ComEC/Rec2 family competence protein [Bryobacteraceae bacterium]|nr:ComEC/Rec2 family competence protein [Bryobacteraceae bacterium]
MAGILVAHYARFTLLELAIPVGLLLGIVVSAHIWAPRCVLAAWTACMFAAGAAVAEYKRPGPAPVVVDAEPGEALLVAGCVVEPLSVRDGRGRFVVEVADGARASISLRAEGETQPLPYGTRVEFPARVRSPRNYGNPGAFDYAGYLARRNTFWTGTVLPRAEITRLDGRCGSHFQAAVQDVRALALARLDGLMAADPAVGGLMRALLLGDDDQLRPDTSDEFRRTGTYHALVISGLHISLIAGSLLWILRRAFVPIWVRLVFSGLVAWAYTLIAGGDAPVLRAAIGFTLALVAIAVHRRARVLNLLAAVAMLFLVLDPGQLFEASFQLSFAAVAAIGGLASPLVERSAAVLRTAARTIAYVRPSSAFSVEIQCLRVELRLLADTLAVFTTLPVERAQWTVATGARFIAFVTETVILSAVIQFALIAPSVFYFHRIPVTSVLANLVSVPALNVAVGLGLTGLITGSTALSSAAAACARFAESTVGWFAALEPNWRPPTPAAWLAIGFVLSLVLLAVALRRHLRITIPAAVLCVGLGGWMCAYDAPPGATGWLEFAAIDVGQGDSLLVVFPDGKTMLIDGGGFPTFKGAPPVRRMDIGEQVVSSYLWTRGLRRLDIVALTHGHEDHAQGLAAVLRNFHPAEFWTGAVPASATELVNQARAQGAGIRELRAGHVQHFGGALVRVLAPAQDYTPGQTARNNDSLVLEISYGRRRFLLTGDAERAVELELVTREMLRRTDVLKLAHHGSKTSTLPDLLAATRPSFAVISAGEGNLYNHPHPDVLARIREYKVKAFRTDRVGLTRFRTDGNRLLVETNGLDWRED